MRIGINVPDELLQRLEPLKQVTNVSQICRDAIKGHVEAYELANERVTRDGMDEVADRLWREDREQTVDWEALGHEDAKMWVQLATLKDFEDLFHNLKVLKRQGRTPYIIVARYIPGTRTIWDRRNEHKEWFYRRYELDEKTNFHVQTEADYTRGWLSYVNAVWQTVRGRVAADSMSDHAALDRERSKVELPAHLASAKRAK